MSDKVAKSTIRGWKSAGYLRTIKIGARAYVRPEDWDWCPAPNAWLRSALFGMVERGSRTALKNHQVAALNNIEIIYTGFQLDQGDLDVMLQAVHLCNLHREPEGLIRFGVNEFLKAIGRQPGKSGRTWLRESLRRLSATTLEITVATKDDIYTYGGSLVDEFHHSKHQQAYYLRINKHLKTIFDAGWSSLHRRQRQALKTDLARWLHGFYSSHQDPHPLKVRTLLTLCGSRTPHLRNFRAKLCSALDELMAIEALSAWELDFEDKVHVTFFSLPAPSEVAENDQGPPASDASEEPPEERVPVLSIPLIPKDGEFAVYEDDIAEWQTTFPGVDVVQKLRHIRKWNLDNPSRRKTAKGIRKHITNWLAKEQDRTAGFLSKAVGNETEAEKAEKAAQAEIRRTQSYLRSLRA